MRTLDALSYRGACCVVSTAGRSNSLLALPAEQEIARWIGAEVISCAISGTGTIVCAALDGYIYLVRDGGVVALNCGLKTFWPLASVAVTNTEVLVVGTNGKLVFVDVEQASLRHAGLGDWGIPKPGRRILAAFPGDDGTVYLGGAHQMLLRFDGRSMVPLLEMKADTLITGGAAAGSGILVARNRGPLTTLCHLAEGRVTEHEQFRSRTPVVTRIGSEFLVGSRSVWQGRPGSWVELCDFGSDCLVGLAPVDGGALIAVGYDGTWRRVALAPGTVS